MCSRTELAFTVTVRLAILPLGPRVQMDFPTRRPRPIPGGDRQRRSEQDVLAGDILSPRTSDELVVRSQEFLRRQLALFGTASN